MRNDFSKELNRLLWGDFKDAYRGYSSQAFVIWCFLKYCLDKNICEPTKEGFENLSNIKSDFYNHRIDAEKIDIWFTGIDKEYNQNDLLSRFASFFKDGVKYHDSIISVISRFDFAANPEETMELVKSGLYFFQSSLAGRYSSSTTSMGISKIAAGILNVDEKDIFMDFCVGSGLSTLEIVKDKNTEIRVADINVEARALALMLFIMNGYKNFTIESFENQKSYKVTKLFSDLPVIPDGEKISAATKYHAEFLIRAKNALDENGVAVLVVPGKYLFSSMDAIRYSRDVLLVEQCLDSVIALPFTFEGTSLTANLIVLRKNASRPLFIDASRFNTTFADIDSIVSLYKDREEVNGVSKIVSKEDILANGTSFSPARYAMKVVVVDVDKELEETQKQLDEAMNRLNHLLNK